MELRSKDEVSTIYEVVDEKEKLPEACCTEYSTMSMVTMNRENIYTEASTTATASSKESRKYISFKIKTVLMYTVAIFIGIAILLLIFGCLIP